MVYTSDIVGYTLSRKFMYRSEMSRIEVDRLSGVTCIHQLIVYPSSEIGEMDDSSLSAISLSTCSEFHILTEVDGMYERNKLTEESIAKLRDKIEIQKRKVSDSLTSSFIFSQGNKCYD